MPWPFPEELRPYIRMAAVKLAAGFTEPEVVAWMAGTAAFSNAAMVERALPEAQRSLYFANRIASDTKDLRLSQLWGLSARAAWYAGYHRAPTAAERAWAFQRPGDMVGMTLRVSGRGLRTGAAQDYTVTLNAPWGARLSDISEEARDFVGSFANIIGIEGSEPIDPATLVMEIEGGALLPRQVPSFAIEPMGRA